VLEKCERAVGGGQVGERHAAHGRIHLRLEVVDVEFVEIAEYDVTRTAGYETSPVVEGLAVVAGKFFPALFHFDQDNGLPDIVGEAGATAIFLSLANAKLWLPANVERTGVTKGNEETIKEDLRLAFLVASDMGLSPLNEDGKGRVNGISHVMQKMSGPWASTTDGYPFVEHSPVSYSH
jgi:hypothetical protein